MATTAAFSFPLGTLAWLAKRVRRIRLLQPQNCKESTLNGVHLRTRSLRPNVAVVGEVAGVRSEQLRKADRTLRRLVRGGLHDSNPTCGKAVREIIAWADIEAALVRAGYLDSPGLALRRVRPLRSATTSRLRHQLCCC